jgi:hypothetical protein
MTAALLFFPVSSLLIAARAEDPYQFYTSASSRRYVRPSVGTVHARIAPFFFLLCSLFDFDSRFSTVTQGILIIGQFPGPQIDAVTNDNIIINVFNNLPAPFLLSW